MRRTEPLAVKLFAGAITGFGLILVLTGCGTASRWEQPPSAARPAPPPAPVVNDSGQPPRAKRGNPAFYEVYGKRYYVMSSSAGYRERGVASWYGKKFHGKSTSSGERYNMHAMTAAHKTLPLPTRVRVTNLGNGRSVVVMVNDRGPFVDNRVIDLSYAAATRLDMIGPGTALVEVEELPSGQSGSPAMAGPPPATGATAIPAVAGIAATQTPAAPAQVLYLQVGAFGDSANANQLKDRLVAGGMTNVVIHAETGGARELYRVRLGPITDVAAYDELVRRVADLDISDTHLVTETSASSNSQPAARQSFSGGS